MLLTVPTPLIVDRLHLGNTRTKHYVMWPEPPNQRELALYLTTRMVMQRVTWESWPRMDGSGAQGLLESLLFTKVWPQKPIPAPIVAT